jgi:hypothetical protein
MTSIRLLLTALIAAGSSSNVLAQDFFDFGTIPGVPAEPSVEIDLNSAMLAFVSQAAEASGTDAAGALDGLKNVRVRVYEELTDANAVAAFVDESSRALDRAGWQRAVYVADDEDKVRMYVKTQGQNVSGMTLMVVDDEEAVFVNIDGTIDPAQLGRLAGMMGVEDVLGSFGGNGNRPGAQQGQGRYGRQAARAENTPQRQAAPQTGSQSQSAGPASPQDSSSSGATTPSDATNSDEAPNDGEPTEP